MKRLVVLLPLLMLFPNLAFAGDFFDFEWASHDNDRSIHYLGLVFGQVGTVLFGEGNQLFGRMFEVFNVVVLSLAIVVITFSAITSTITTAQEGEVFGKKWSSIWMPFKAIAGIGLLVPTTSGYSIIQVFMMWVILQGIHGANLLWNKVLDTVETGQGISESLNVDELQAINAAKGAFQATVCMNKLNTIPEYQQKLDNQEVEIYLDPVRNDRILIGVNDPTSPYQQVCGYFQIGAMPLPASQMSYTEWERTQRNAAENVLYAMEPYAAELVEFPNEPGEWTGKATLAQGAKTVKLAVGSLELQGSSSTTLSNFVQAASQDGWIHAGAYYFQLTSTANTSPTDNVRIGSPRFVPPTGNQGSHPILEHWPTAVEMPMNQYFQKTDLEATATSTSNFALNIPSEMPSEVQSMGSGVSTAFSSLARSFIKYLGSRADDPLASYKTIGQEIMTVVEILIWVLVALIIIIMGFGCIMAMTNPFCYVLGTIMVMLMPILMVILALLWSAGVALGLYVPLIPYLVFTFTAVGWMILCIETLVAAPIVALGITTPGNDLLGRASPAVLLITNVFLRPALMIVGLIAAGRLIKPVIEVLNYGFEAFVILNVGVLLLFGNIALIVIYAGISIAVFHQIFSLISALPDHVIRWIGGQAEESAAEKMMQEVEEASQSAAKTTEGMMKGMTQGASAISQKGADKSEDSYDQWQADKKASKEGSKEGSDDSGGSLGTGESGKGKGTDAEPGGSADEADKSSPEADEGDDALSISSDSPQGGSPKPEGGGDSGLGESSSSSTPSPSKGPSGGSGGGGGGGLGGGGGGLGGGGGGVV